MARKQALKTIVLPNLTRQADQIVKGSIKPVYTIKLAVMTLCKYKINNQTSCKVDGKNDSYRLVWFKFPDHRLIREKDTTLKANRSESSHKMNYGQRLLLNANAYEHTFIGDLLLIAPGEHLLVRGQKYPAIEEIDCYIASYQAAYLNVLARQLFGRNIDELTGNAQSWPDLASQINRIEEEYHARLPGHVFMLNNLCAQLAIETIRTLRQHKADHSIENPAIVNEQGAVNLILRDQLGHSFIVERKTNYAGRESVYKQRSICKYEKIKQVAQDIRNNCGSDICVTSLAVKYQMHPSYLCRCFRSVYKKTILAYRTECRIELACLLLRKDDMRIARIAGLCGYRSVSRFSEQFKKLTGLTPTQYRIKLYRHDKLLLT